MSREPPSLMAKCPLTPSLTQKLSPTQNLDPNLLTKHSCSHTVPQPSLVASWSRISALRSRQRTCPDELRSGGREVGGPGQGGCGEAARSRDSPVQPELPITGQYMQGWTPA